MTWAVFNALSFGAKPIWLIRIIVGTAESHFAVNSSSFTTPIGAPNADFTAETAWAKSGISVGRIDDNSVRQKRVVRIGLPRKLALADTILALDTATRVQVDIWQGFVGDPDNEFIRFFSGTARQKNPRYRELILECFDEIESFNNPAISRAVQRPCPYAVYDSACRALRANFRIAGTATALTELVLTVTEAAAQPDGIFNAGILEFAATEQRIRKHVGTQLTLHAPVPGLEQEIIDNGSASVNLLFGCTKSAQICQDRFNNDINHGGFEDISTSPFDGNGIL